MGPGRGPPNVRFHVEATIHIFTSKLVIIYIYIYNIHANIKPEWNTLTHSNKQCMFKCGAEQRKSNLGKCLVLPCVDTCSCVYLCSTRCHETLLQPESAGYHPKCGVRMSQPTRLFISPVACMRDGQSLGRRKPRSIYLRHDKAMDSP